MCKDSSLSNSLCQVVIFHDACDSLSDSIYALLNLSLVIIGDIPASHLCEYRLWWWPIQQVQKVRLLLSYREVSLPPRPLSKCEGLVGLKTLCSDTTHQHDFSLWVLLLGSTISGICGGANSDSRSLVDSCFKVEMSLAKLCWAVYVRQACRKIVENAPWYREGSEQYNSQQDPLWPPLITVSKYGTFWSMELLSPKSSLSWRTVAIQQIQTLMDRSVRRVSHCPIQGKSFDYGRPPRPLSSCSCSRKVCPYV